MGVTFYGTAAEGRGAIFFVVKPTELLLLHSRYFREGLWIHFSITSAYDIS